jgi:KDO2-lipid IV(A) lauroyltransferase
MDLVTPGYRAASRIAQTLPRPVIEGAAPRLVELWSLRPTDRRRMVERHQQRVRPWLKGAALRRQVAEVYRSYGRYYAESFRLPGASDAEVDARMTVDGWDNFEQATSGPLGPLMVLPHLGSWEWCAQWLARVKGFQVTAIVEKLEPPALFEWFTEYRREMGVHVVPLGPEAGRQVTQAVKDRHVIALLSDRDIGGKGIEVEFFGEKTTLPGGPATLALRLGAPIFPVAIYDRPGGGHHAVCKPPLDTARRGPLRADVTRITQDIATALEELIRVAPEQWHLMQPNWPSDRELFPDGDAAAEAAGDPADSAEPG